jgi:hypothetical protein
MQTLDFVDQDQQFSVIVRDMYVLLPVAAVRSAANWIILIWMDSPMVLWLFWDEYVVFCVFLVLDMVLNKDSNSNMRE